MDPFFSYIEQNRNTISNALYVSTRQKQTYFEEVKLPDRHNLSSVSLEEALYERHSTHMYKENSAIDAKNLSTMLSYGYGTTKGNTRAFPSAGSFYAQSLIVMIQNVTGLKRGMYEYEHGAHTLGLLHKTIPSKEILAGVLSNEEIAYAPVILFFVFHKSENIKKYGSYSYPHAFLEAGHVGQNMYLIASALGIGCCAIGSARYSKFNEILKLSGTASSHVYAIAIGPLSEII